jgi:hypothetical protein
MRILCSAALVLVAIFLFGCVHEKTSTPQYAEIPRSALTTPSPTLNPASGAPSEPSASQKLIVTPTEGLTGKVSRVNPNLRFVVLTFPIGQMPDVSRAMNLYRQGLKVAEVKITGPQRNDSIVADIITGDAELGDEARDR